MKLFILSTVVAALLVPAVSSSAQSVDPLEAIQQRLDALEQQNADLRNELRVLREELDKVRQPRSPSPDVNRLDALEEKVDLQTTRQADQDLVKAESSQRVPIRLTGMVLFNAFRNSRHANPARDNPLYAAATAAATSNSGGTLRQSLFGLDFHTPEAILGGQFRGSVLFDVFALSDSAGERPPAVPLNTSPRLRTAWIEGRWRNRSVLAGLANSIIASREPSSLAQVFVPPLSAAGNLYGWRQQIRFEQRARLGERQEFVGQIAALQTSEDWPRVQTAFASTLESKRPAIQMHVAFSHAVDEKRRIEVGSGFHGSQTHIAGASIPSRIYSLDWLVTPTDRIAVSGMLFAGKNVGNLAGRMAYSFSILTPSPGVIRAVAVRAHGGWAQLGFQATPRLRLHVYGGLEDPNDDDAIGLDGAIRNAVGAANTFFQVAPNVITGFEISQTRTWWKAGQRPRLNHLDLYVAYLF
jgi:hypothetical protein